MPNTELERIVETTDEWIAQRTGIRNRHLLAPGEGLSQLGSGAAQRALEHANVDPAGTRSTHRRSPQPALSLRSMPKALALGPFATCTRPSLSPWTAPIILALNARADIDLVIFATSTPDDLFGDAAGVAKAVGATNAVAFDLTAACSGFLFGVTTASQVC